MKTKQLLLTLGISIAGSGASFGQPDTNTNLGSNAGNAGLGNTSIGYYAGDVVTGTTNSFVGYQAGLSVTSGESNSFLGSYAGLNTTTGSVNLFLGAHAGYQNMTGGYNTFVGNSSGWANTGIANSYLGYNAGGLSTGSFNIFLGYRSGFYETGSNKLYIDNSDTSTPLIYGDFSTDQLTINGSIRGNISGALRVNSGNGYMDLGAQNASWAHFQTDRPRFFFQKGITVDEGLIGSYDEDLNLQTAGSTRMTILNGSNGSVGIGTTAPSNLQGWHKVLDVRGLDHSKVLATTTNGEVRSGIFSHNNWGSPGAIGVIGTESNHSLHLMANYDLKMSILTTGDVGIGTAAPSAKLHLYNPASSIYMALDKVSSTYESGLQFRKAGSVQFYLFTDDGSDALKIEASGLAGETDATPRMQFPKANKDVYIAESGGSVVIGSNSPGAKLDVVGPPSGTGVTLRAAGGGDVVLNSGGSLFFDGNYSYGSGNFIRPVAANTQVFFTSGVERLRISPSGLLGLGNIVPTEMLDVNGTARLRSITQDNTLTRLLVSDANGKLFWRQATPVQGDNLGNHTATQTLAPNSSNSLDLGNSANTFRSIYVGTKIVCGNDTDGNTSVGYNSGAGGTNNTFFGKSTGSLTTGIQNTFIGVRAGDVNTTGANNTYMGTNSGRSATTGNYNTSVGVSSGDDLTTGSDNVLIGPFSGSSLTTGSRNVFIGSNAGAQETGSDKLYVENGGSTTPLIYGDFATDRVGINKVPNQPGSILEVQNAYCDGSTWYNSSDRNLKMNFRSISNEGILDKLMTLKIERWTYQADTANADHIGPVAQDFNKTFALGSNDRAISTVDEIGIALAAIQELNRKTDKLNELVQTQCKLILALLESKASEGLLREGSAETELFQNSPNPFKSVTEIRMKIHDSVNEAVLLIYDMQGRQIDRALVRGRGTRNHIVEGNTLSAGMYLYALVADGQTVAVKRMILTE